MLLPLAVASLVLSPLAQASELHVQTTSGEVHGFYNTSSETVRTFLGIPYGESTAGEHRFKAPMPKAPSNATFHATSFGPSCPGIYPSSSQSIWSALPFWPWDIKDMSEDCLSINIWAPAANHSKTANQSADGAAVMMYIYGGGFLQGSTATAFYDGSNLVEHNDDIIVVTFNYRVSVLGHPNAPGIAKGKQNVGLLDQRLAVEWVYNNIANFGGDPSRIMLFGQSAGAAATDMYTFTYSENPLVQSVALESGAASVLTSNDTTHENWKNLAKSMNCSSDEHSLKCMQDLPFQMLLNAVETGPYDFSPVEDNVTVFTDWAARANEGKIARLPALIGINEREGAVFFDLNATSINETLVSAVTQEAFNCPTLLSTQIRLAQGIPTWRYLYHGNWSNLSPVPWLGAYHSSEMPMVFGTYNKSPIDSPPSAAQVAASKYIQGAWTAFAKDPYNGLREYQWPQFNPNGNTLINLALDNRVSAVFTSGAKWDGFCQSLGST